MFSRFTPSLISRLRQAIPAAPPPARRDLDILEPLSGDMQRVGRRSPHDDRRAMLVVVKDGDIHALAADPLDREAIGCLDVLEG